MPSDGKTLCRQATSNKTKETNSLIEMLNIMAKQFVALGDDAKSAQCVRIANGVLDVFRNEDGKALEIPGYEWIDS